MWLWLLLSELSISIIDQNGGESLLHFLFEWFSWFNLTGFHHHQETYLKNYYDYPHIQLRVEIGLRKIHVFDFLFLFFFLNAVAISFFSVIPFLTGFTLSPGILLIQRLKWRRQHVPQAVICHCFTNNRRYTPRARCSLVHQTLWKCGRVYFNDFLFFSHSLLELAVANYQNRRIF